MFLFRQRCNLIEQGRLTEKKKKTTVIRNPFLFILLLLSAGGTYVAYNLSLLGPMMQMTNAAANQASEIGKQKLREFLENNETARQALAMPASSKSSGGEQVRMDTLDSKGKKKDYDDDGI